MKHTAIYRIPENPARPDGWSLRLTVDYDDEKHLAMIERAAQAADLHLERIDQDDPPGTARCSSCKAPIIWAQTSNEKRMPLDAHPTDDGTFVLRRDPALEAPLALTMRTTTILASEPLYTSHFATCPNADQHRRR